jgi:mycothiol synthase
MTLAARPARPSDLGAVLGICRAFEIAFIGETEFTIDDLRDEWQEIDLDRNTWLVEADGVPAGFMQVGDRGAGLFIADGYVHPQHAGRGVGSLMIDLAEARADELAAGRPDLERAELQNAVLEADSAAGRLLVSRGYRPVRHFLRMVIDMVQRPPVDEPPAGIRIEPFRAADAAAAHGAVMEAMADHWSFIPKSLDRWLAPTRRERFDPGLWLVAWDGPEVAAVLQGEWKRNDMGWIDSLATRRAWRGRGIAGALLTRAFAEFYDRGERRCGLGVDAENPTGAGRVYERVGMRRLWRADVYSKKLRG